MPLIEEKVLNDLYTELDKLKSDKEQLQTGFVNLKLKSNKAKKNYRRNLVIFGIVIILLLSVLGYLYNNQNNAKSIIQSKEQKIAFLLDSIQKTNKLLEVKKVYVNPDVFYTIQLGVFKKLDLDIQTKENFSFKEIESNNKRIYQLGVFSSYTTATLFKEEIKKIGLNDAFIVPYNKESDRIDIKKALILSNEEFYIKD